jgi:hypothetical protein
MKCPTDNLFTPIYLKTSPHMPWPEDEKAFYLLSRDGLFFCRNHPFYKSCVEARGWPRELAPQDEVLELRYPKIGRRLLEVMVGFFDKVADLHGAEAALLLAWNPSECQIEVIAPEQVATVGETSRGLIYPIGVKYEIPESLAADWTIIGDIHSHVYEDAYASWTDKEDETHRAGLHIVVGRLQNEPPELHIEAVVDGTRFKIEPARVFGGYRQRSNEFPKEWLDQVKVENKSSCRKTAFESQGDAR